MQSRQPTLNQVLLNNIGVHYQNNGDMRFAFECYTKVLKLHAINVCQKNISQHGILRDRRRSSSTFQLEEALAKLAILSYNDIIQTPKVSKLYQESSQIGMRYYSSPLEMKPHSTLGADQTTPTDPNENEAVIVSIFNLSLLHMKIGNFDNAVKLLNIVLRCNDFTAMLNTIFPSSAPLEVMLLTNLGYIYYRHCEHEKARFFFDKVTKLTEELSIDLRLHKIRTSELELSKVRHFGSSLLNLSRVHEATGNYNEAMVLVKKVGALRDVLRKFSSEREVTELSGLDFIKARIHFLKHDYRHALILYQSFVHGNLRSIPPLQKAAALHGIGEILFEERNMESAMSYLRTALTIREQTHGESHYEVTETLYMVGRILHDQGEYVDALEVYNIAVKIQCSVLGVEHISTLKTFGNIARVSHIREERFEDLNVCTEIIVAGQAA